MNVILYVMVVFVLTTSKVMDNFALNSSFLFSFSTVVYTSCVLDIVMGEK